jgi:leader peptidase (prepilin peptidase)/N-methyltransferase
MPRDLSVVAPRSFCPSCEEPIAWYDNVPVLSWLVLGGQCRHCKARIPFRYPLVELLTASVFMLTVYELGATLGAVKYCLFGALLIALLFTDLEERILPDEFTIGGTVAAIVLAAFIPMPPGLIELLLPRDWSPPIVSMIESAAAAVFLSLVLWGIGQLYYRLRKREGLGLGDVKMVGMMGAFLGLSGALFAVIVGSVLGSIIGIGYIWLADKEARSYELPFGTFLAIGGLAAAAQVAVTGFVP